MGNREGGGCKRGSGTLMEIDGKDRKDGPGEPVCYYRHKSVMEAINCHNLTYVY